MELGLLALRVDGHDLARPVADQVDDRVRHLQSAAVCVDLAEESYLESLAELPFAPRLVEEDDVDAGRNRRRRWR